MTSTNQFACISRNNLININYFIGEVKEQFNAFCLYQGNLECEQNDMKVKGTHI